MSREIAAVVLAAGQSQRMGQPKMALPWGDTTVIGQVVASLQAGGISTLVVVTGGARAEVEAALRGAAVRLAFNPRFAEDDMAVSLRAGLAALPEEVEATLVALGDQPQIDPDVVRAVADAYRGSGAPLVAPSYRMRRGHPWLVARRLWPEVFDLGPGGTLRDLFSAHAAEIHYVEWDSPAILKDLDTPQDYARERPGSPTEE